MCGIVGYIGNSSAITPVIEGLEALEYRGYDSAGITTISDKKTLTIKQIGRVDSLKPAIDQDGDKTAKLAIGHTRWATHGVPSNTNAHPHQNTSGTIFVVHNGIIENYQTLRAMLKKDGYKFVSETDTEVIPNLIDYFLKAEKDFFSAFKLAIKELEGAYAIAAVYANDPDSIFVARLSSPLVIGVGESAHYVASDATAIMQHTKKVVYLNDYEVAVVKKAKVHIEDLRANINTSREAQELEHDLETAELGQYEHFMAKEIDEGPQTIQSASRGRLRLDGNIVKLGGLESVEAQLKYIDRIVIVACGTSYYAGLVGEYLIEEIAGIPVEVELASEFKYRHEPFSRSTALLAISQSGETADTIAALKKVEDYGVLRLGVVNAVGSTIARMTDAGVYCHAGPERSVASTKAFLAQVTVLAEIALYLSQGRSLLYKPVLKELLQLPDKLKTVLEQAEKIEALAKKYRHYRDFLYIGRGYAYPSALEGALKLKELSYIHAEAFAAGEMKHGPLALIDEHFPTFALIPDGDLLEKTLSNVQEIKARSGPVIAIATKGNKSVARLADDVIYIPPSLEQLQPLLMVPVMQLFAYYVTVHKQLDVDKPRNLAKSVTVE
ncbi:glutamine--fructose-6-phosphate transaminase (isomerizing) [Candidatus Saccharibacteria bacterium]|nr:glutamine--fructose-6-phosphate transaminase (isomerizing) [Candidatus Saccharibacteria bacterium]